MTGNKETAANCDSIPRPTAGQARVTACIQRQETVFELCIEVNTVYSAPPRPGQFYLLRSRPSAVLLCRPISVWHTAEKNGIVSVFFLILQKGIGTAELCALKPDDSLDFIGPLGNLFPPPKEGPIALIGGGIGVAPVAAFAESLQKNTSDFVSPYSYDFFACFKSGSYGMEHLTPKNCYISTDDGSAGIKGMLPVIFDAQTAAQYKTVYACGPEPMLRHVQECCAQSGTDCFISMEARMACGVGACLGCTIPTVNGNKRCCKEGPVFSAQELILEPRK